jgi:hypothetical protein
MKWRRRPTPTLKERIAEARAKNDRIEGTVADVERRHAERVAAERADQTRLHVCPVWGCEHQVIAHIYRPGFCPDHHERVVDTEVRAHELSAGAR